MKHGKILESYGGIMRVAIIDDEESVRNQIVDLVSNFCTEKEIPKECICYSEAVSFLENYKADFDVIFLDIKMPKLNGMKAAEMIRQYDKNVIIVFITNLKQYAILGYSVDAIGFIVKPIEEYNFNVLMEKVIREVTSRKNNDLTIKTVNGLRRVKIIDIYYIEIIKHKLIYHTAFGDIEAWGSLATEQDKLPRDCFSRCNVCYLLNLLHVQAVEGDTVSIGGDSLKIARSRKKEFLSDLARFGGTGGI